MTDTTEPAAIPPQAITAAAEAIHDLIWRTADGTDLCGEAVLHEDAMREAYAQAEAAAPHLAAVERERCAQIIRELLGAATDLMNEMHALIPYPPDGYAADGRWELAEAAAADLLREQLATPPKLVHYTPEEHDQPACDADIAADPGETMWGTLNPDRVTCPACKALREQP